MTELNQADLIMFGRRTDTRRYPELERIRGTEERQCREYELDNYLTPVDEDYYMAWYSVKEGAERLGVSPRAVRKRIKAGTLDSLEAPNPGGGRPAHEAWLGNGLISERMEPVKTNGIEGIKSVPFLEGFL